MRRYNGAKLPCYSILEDLLMNRNALSAAVIAALGTVLLTPSAYSAETPTDNQEAAIVEEMSILGLREQRTSKGATGLRLSIFDTPQSVSVLDQAMLQDFALDDINESLKMITGVNVEEVETDRTYYNSRGFDIKSMQVDGKGLPFTWNVAGELDTAMYEKVEVVRGANGLLTGTGNPSGTINYVRKRPTNEFTGALEYSGGSWNKRRIEADVSAPLTDSGSWATRVVLVGHESDTWLDDNHKKRTLMYGIVDGQLNSNNTLAVGFSKQQGEAEGVLWGALPLIYSNGEQTNFDVSESTTMNWTYWEVDHENVFVELSTELGGWEWVNTLGYNNFEEPTELFYTYGSLNQDTGLGLLGWPGKYFQTVEQNMFDSTLNGEFELGNRQHELIVGLNLSKSQNGYLDHTAPADSPAWGELPPFPGWNGTEIPRPDFSEPFVAADFETDVKRLYAVTRLNLNNALNLIVGANGIDTESSGVSFDSAMNWSESDVSPYLGITWALTDYVNLYSSYSDIFEPQVELNEDLQNLGPATGTSFEAGIKARFFDDSLVTSFAVFTADQENYAEYAGFDVDNGVSFYSGTEVSSEGFELEASGEIAEALTLFAGYTQLNMEDPEGNAIRTYVPERTFKAGTRYNFSDLLEMGASLRWQSDIHIGESPARIEQDSYFVLSAFVDYSINETVRVALNINNLSDEKYLSSLYWDQAFYGAPREVSVSARFSF